ncbi:MAG: TolC family protein [Bacteroidales bacterium]|nr:TolC family protein [Bacteroidales bacterium]
MKIVIVKTAITVFIAFCVFYTTSGQQPDSLAHYLEMATKNNPLVLQKYYEYKAALQKIPQAGSLPDPELSMGVFLSPMEIISGKQAADIRLMQIFPWFGVLKNAKDEMSLMANARYESLRETRLQVWFDVQQTWYELFKTSQYIRIAEKNMQILKSIEKLALTKFSSGMGASASQPGMNDVIGVQIEMGDLENNIALLKSRFQTITARFNSYLNRPANAAVSLPDSILAETSIFSFLQISDSMLTGNPMAGMYHYEQQSLAARKKMVSRMGLPMVGIGLNYSVIQKSNMSASEMNGNDMVMPMVTVTLPVYRKKYKAMQNEAGMMQAAASQGYEAAVNALQSEYYEAVQFYHDAKRRVDLYANQKRLASQSFDIMTKNFSASGIGLTDLLRYQQLLLDYENRQFEAIADYNTSVAWLKKLMADAPIQEFKAIE